MALDSDSIFFLVNELVNQITLPSGTFTLISVHVKMPGNQRHTHTSAVVKFRSPVMLKVPVCARTASQKG